MAHIIVGIEGLPEGVKDLLTQIDRKGYTKGTIRARPILLYDIQVPKEDKERLLRDLGYVKEKYFKEHKYENKTFGWKMKYKVSPFKHGRFRMIPYLFFKLFGWIIGIKPVKPVSSEIKNEEPIIPRMTNIYVLGEVEDNAWIVDARRGKKETEKDVEIEYL